VVIAISLVVYLFVLKNRAVTALDREQGLAYEVDASPGRVRA
jgi:MHS family alpha-ketoglutarate permease-like MFS transporter